MHTDSAAGYMQAVPHVMLRHRAQRVHRPRRELCIGCTACVALPSCAESTTMAPQALQAARHLMQCHRAQGAHQQPRELCEQRGMWCNAIECAEHTDDAAVGASYAACDAMPLSTQSPPAASRAVQTARHARGYTNECEEHTDYLCNLCGMRCKTIVSSFAGAPTALRAIYKVHGKQSSAIECTEHVDNVESCQQAERHVMK